MIRSLFRTLLVIVSSLLVSGVAGAQLPAPPMEPVAPAVGTTTPQTGLTPPPIALVPAANTVPTASVAATPNSAVSDGVTGSMKGALGFGVGIIPNAELVGTSAAVALKAWLTDTLAIAPLFSFAFTDPKGSAASWHLRPELIVLFVPFKNASTRFEIGGGLGFALGKAAPPPMDPNGIVEAPNVTFDLTLPIQAGVEHFFTPWFSVGIATRTDLVAYTEDGDFHQIAFSLDSTSLLGQLFLYTD